MILKNQFLFYNSHIIITFAPAVGSKVHKIPKIMKDPMKIYDIPITSLKVGIHTFNYEVTQDLMDFYGYEDHWDDARVSVTVTLEKRVNVMRLDIDAVGDIHTWCDVTDEEFRLPIEGHESLTVKVQEIPSDDDQVIVLSPLDTVLNVGQWIYEVIVLSVPQKRYHPSYLEREGSEWNDEEEDGYEELLLQSFTRYDSQGRVVEAMHEDIEEIYEHLFFTYSEVNGKIEQKSNW